MIATQTLNFLSKLSENNNRPWFEEHKHEYLEAKESFEEFIAVFLEELAKEEPEFSLLSPKKCVFRIYRDVRFSKNKAPYKNHLAAGISKGGKRVHTPGYHLHISPGISFFAGGIWRPDKEMLAKIRQEIDYNLDEFQTILKSIEKQHVFDKFEDEEALIRAPKGYEIDNPAIEYLRMKSFVITQSFEDKELQNKDFLQKILSAYRALRPFNAFLERALDD